jgi:aspartate kinase
MVRTEVHKFGGTSVGDADRMAAAADIVLQASRRARVVVVASAMAGVTDSLVAAADAARRGERQLAVETLRAVLARHQAALAASAVQDAGRIVSQLDQLGEEAIDMVKAVSHLRQLSPSTRDRLLSLGEKLSVRLLAGVMRQRGLDAEAMDADEFLETDDSFGEANPVPGVVNRSIAAALLPVLERGAVPVVTGFVGRAPDGSTTTLGRGGSDFSATLVGAALDAAEVVIWTDVDGVYSANPAVVPQARRIEQLNFREAAELSFYGAKVLHQRTIIPVASRGIPVRIRNSFAPELQGTAVDHRDSQPSPRICRRQGHGWCAGRCRASVRRLGRAAHQCHHDQPVKL